MDADMIQIMKDLQASMQGVVKSVDGLAQRFDDLEGRFGGFEKRFDGLEGRFDGFEKRFDGLEGRFDGFEKRFDGLEGRFDWLETGLTRKFNRLTMEFDRFGHALKQDFRDHAEKMEGIYRHAAWAAESAKVSADKVISHGPMLVDHEDRIRALEGKRKTPPAA